MRNHDFVSKVFLALITTCLVLLCSSWLVIALLAWLWRSRATPMTDQHKAEVPNMSQRTVMQCLSLDDWKVVAHLPVPAGELMLSRILDYGWIEGRGEKQRKSNQAYSRGAQGAAVGGLKPSTGWSSSG